MAKSGNGGAKRESLALQLAAGLSVRAAAAAAGVSERTARQWREDSAFRMRIAQLRSEMTCRALGVLTRSQRLAARELRSLLKSSDDSVRLRASIAILQVGSRLTEHVELTERIRELEISLGANQKGQTVKPCSTYGDFNET